MRGKDGAELWQVTACVRFLKDIGNRVTSWFLLLSSRVRQPEDQATKTCFLGLLSSCMLVFLEEKKFGPQYAFILQNAQQELAIFKTPYSTESRSAKFHYSISPTAIFLNTHP